MTPSIIADAVANMFQSPSSTSISLSRQALNGAFGASDRKAAFEDHLDRASAPRKDPRLAPRKSERPDSADKAKAPAAASKPKDPGEPTAAASADDTSWRTEPDRKAKQADSSDPSGKAEATDQGAIAAQDPSKPDASQQAPATQDAKQAPDAAAPAVTLAPSLQQDASGSIAALLIQPTPVAAGNPGTVSAQAATAAATAAVAQATTAKATTATAVATAHDLAGQASLPMLQGEDAKADAKADAAAGKADLAIAQQTLPNQAGTSTNSDGSQGGSSKDPGPKTPHSPLPPGPGTPVPQSLDTVKRGATGLPIGKDTAQPPLVVAAQAAEAKAPAVAPTELAAAVEIQQGAAPVEKASDTPTTQASAAQVHPWELPQGVAHAEPHAQAIGPRGPEGEAAPLKEALRATIVQASKDTGKPTEMRLQLSPEHLGRMEIRVMATENGLSAQIRVQEPQARDLMHTQLADLRQTLADQGIKIDKLEVNVGQDPKGQESNGFDLAGGFQQQQQSQQQPQNHGTPFNLGGATPYFDPLAVPITEEEAKGAAPRAVGPEGGHLDTHA